MDWKVNRRQTMAIGIAGAAGAGAMLEGMGVAAVSGPEPIVTRGSARDLITVTAGTNFVVAPAPDGSTLAIDLGGMIWLLPVAGGKAHRLTDPMLEASQPDWLGDGKGLVFQAYTHGYFQLWRVDATSGELQQLTTGTADSREPAVSPDGKRIAYVSDRGRRCRVHILDLATLQSTAWNDFPGEAAQPSWSPDGREIVCVVDGHRIVAASQAGPVREIAAVPRGRNPLDRSLVAGPAFTFDGKGVAYVEVIGVAARLRTGGGADLVSGEDVFPFRPRWQADGRFFYSADGAIRRRAPGAAKAADVPFELALALPRNQPRKPRAADAPGKPQPVRGIGSPALSPDGGQIAFRALNALWIMLIGQPPREILADGYCIVDPAWSPDGRQLAFASDRGGTFDIWLRDNASGALRQLTHHDGAASGPAWSPDGKRVSFLDQKGALFVCTVDGGEVRKVQGPLFLPGKPSWGRDGKTLALAALVPSSARFREGKNQILLVDVDSGKSRYLSLPGEASIATRGDDGPVWSPDGSHIAFVVASRLWVWPIGPDGTPTGDPRAIGDEIADCPSWSADGRKLLYLSAGKLRLTDPSGAAPVTIPMRFQWARPKRDRRMLVRAGKMWDGQRRIAQEMTDIGIVNGTITSVSPASGEKPGGDVEFVDASSLMVMPGLVDVHTHLQMAGHGYGDREGRLWLSMGITTIRSLAGPAYHMVEYREAIASGRRVGPHVIATGEAIDGPRIFYHMMRPVTEPGQLARELERARALSYDVMKCYVRLPAETQREVVRWGHRHGLPATSHYLYPGAFFGMDGLEHMGATNKLGYSHTVSQTGRVYGDVEAALAHTGAAHVPTLFQASVLYRDDPALVEDERLRTLLPPWEYARLKDLVRATDPASRAAQLGILEHNVAHVRRLMALGGLIVSGTDAPLDLAGASLHMNLRGMVRFGVTPVDALFTATRNAGRMLNQRIGEIARGARADLAIVSGNPLERIEDAANVRQVIAGGVRHDIPSLLTPFRAGSAGMPSPVTASILPRSPYWWHQAAFVEGCRGSCCSHA
ncbi:amidohydrolase family protein [uncultured Sphingomonas sp.]|uniref:amidohydrolase family protein n=1 Tax=uncultured Sphingomonas sp. TaxID=158754 RepID=UPI00261A405C|nr:amidohydrolase family protein [uncultured Sphingomonas sp.]